MLEFLTFLLDDAIMPIKSEQLLLTKGDKLPLEDAGNRYVYGISEGIIAVQKEEMILDFSSIGQFVGFYADGNSRIEGEVLTKSAIVWKFELRDILTKIGVNNDGFLLYSKHASHMHDSLMKKISILKLNNTNKLILSLRSLASRFGESATDLESCRLPECFTKKVLSNYTGIKLSSLTKVLNNLHDDGKIVHSRRVILVHI
ncbi:Crp/Fnr family transcriptional regulator [Listeria booriae]|uniref:Crp/Fnr family transcriptional regulator n=1 Tax=Listeria booriae TaxID=1552123 RepID=A0A842B0D1_9LIST|nr:Crp/Fnr family transcriptional regulator [Listeria booriae]MBC1795819.1 Crp/Fnr family transcriptional regulator [Listeria booriae]